MADGDNPDIPNDGQPVAFTTPLSGGKYRPRVKAPWDDIETLFVVGERITDPETGRLQTKYPSIRDIANRYGVPRSTIQAFVAKNNCLARRKDAAEHRRKTYAEAVSRYRAKHSAKAVGLSLDEEIEIIDRYLLAFSDALEGNLVDASNPADFNIMIRLKRFLTGGPDARTEVHQILSLENLREKHKQEQDRAGAMNPRVTGMEHDRDHLSREDSEPAKPFALPPAPEDEDDVIDVDAKEGDEDGREADEIEEPTGGAEGQSEGRPSGGG
jgi:DNA-binding transcriptional MerR regulator